MKKYVALFITAFVILSLNSIEAYAYSGDGVPLKYISSCEMDFNKDEKPDIAFLVESLLGRELIILFREESGFKAYKIENVGKLMHLTCHFGFEITETMAGPDDDEKPKTYKTNGTYLKLTRPEASSVVYFWDGNKFVEVWTSD